MNAAAFFFFLYAVKTVAADTARRRSPAFLAGRRTPTEQQEEAAGDVLSFQYGKRPAPASSPSKANFSWQASVDRLTGKAHSLEASNVPIQSKLAITVARSSSSGTRDDRADDTIDLLALATDMFGAYPSWLCRFPVTFGLLHAVPAGGGYQVRSRFFGVKILSFGAPRSRGIKFKNEKERGTDCSVVLPITGGILSLPGPRGDRGSLQFALQTTTRTHDDAAARDSTGDDAAPSAAQTPATTCRIATAISGYRPALCGGAVPVSTWRAGFYLRSQSILHGYIMWKFHRHCRGYETVRGRATRRF